MLLPTSSSSSSTASSGNNHGDHNGTARTIHYKPSRTLMYIRNRSNRRTVSLACLAILVVILGAHRSFSLYMNNRVWMNAPITYLERPCPEPQYERWSQELSGQALKDKVGKICITTLTDHKSTNLFQRFMRWRNYDDVLDLTLANKQNYAKKHGYEFFDKSDLIDTSRPPAWTKVLALQDLLKNHDCHWAVWFDADTVFMNSDIALETLLPKDEKHDFIVAEDDRNGGHNSGVLFFRNTLWSQRFLDDWWNMKSFVRPPGFSLSGDNNALKAILNSMTEFDNYVLVPPRCQINSFAKFVTASESLIIKEHLEEQPWYIHKENYFHKGDLIAHVAGYDNKAATLQLLLDEAH